MSINTKSLQIGDQAPDFLAQTTQGPLSFYKWLQGSWGVLFSHPKDFTPVCTTELGAVAQLKPEFDRRDVKVLALSVSSLDSHQLWIKDINQTQQTTVDFPLIGDEQGVLASQYGMIHPNSSSTATVRSVFIIDPNKKIRLTMCYPASTGRNFAEILRVIDSLQLTDNYSVATPANWQLGDECVILPSITDRVEIEKKFPKGFREVTSYLRLTPQPDLDLVSK